MNGDIRVRSVFSVRSYIICILLLSILIFSNFVSSQSVENSEEELNGIIQEMPQTREEVQQLFDELQSPGSELEIALKEKLKEFEE